MPLTCDSTAPAHAHGNPDEYERLLRNLIDNAARHAAHRIQINVRNQDAWVVITVHDDGPGVPAQDADRVFERFVRLDDARSRDHGGTGLGVAIARDLAHRHQGTLTPGASEPASSYASPRPPPQPRNDAPLNVGRVARRTPGSTGMNRRTLLHL